jgi:hypothetical protein
MPHFMRQQSSARSKELSVLLSSYIDLQRARGWSYLLLRYM